MDDNHSRELLNKIASGNEGAMNEFFSIYNSVVYAFALKRLNIAADAADVLNEVMILVWQKAHSFEGRSKVKTWLLGITNNKILDLLRKRGRVQYDEIDDQLEDENAGSGLLDISQAQDAIAIKQCMDKLSDSHQQVVHLTFYEELSYPEIAEVLGCPAGTVKTRMMHAKTNLKRCLQSLMFD